MKTSIALATYNGDKFLQEQLESYLIQTVLPDELVIVDDCSKDNTLMIINTFKETAPFDVKVYLNETNLGYTQNFNKALQLCNNDLIFISDQDDVWLPNKIEYMVNSASSHPDKDVFISDASIVNNNLNFSGITLMAQFQKFGLDESTFGHGCCTVIRKILLDQIILPIPVNFQGHDSWISKIANTFHLRLIHTEILQLYRIHDSNTSNTEWISPYRKVKCCYAKIIHKLIGLLKGVKIDVLLHQILEGELILKRIRSGTSKSLKQDDIIVNSYIKNIQYLKIRVETLEQKNIFSRFRKGWRFYRNSQYVLKHFMSDVIFQ